METSLRSPQAASNISPKERIKLLLKFSLVGFVFWFLFHKGLLTKESFARLFSSPLTIFICLVLMTLNTLLGALRWQILLRTQGANLSFGHVLKLNMVGSFFNIALPGAVSGDFVKAVYVSQQFKEKRGAVFGSMLFDRILGVAAMVFVASFSTLLSLYISWGGELPFGLLISIAVAGGAILFFFTYLFLSHRRDPLFAVLQFFTRRSEKLGSLDRLYLGVMNYRHHPKRVLEAVGLSVLIHTLLVTLMFFLTESISDQPIPMIALAVTVPIGMLATSIPVLPAGVGTGHAAFYALFKMVGSNLGAEVFSLLILYQILFGIIGGFVYLKMSGTKSMQ